MQTECRFVDVGGRSLYARISGTGPTVVLNSGAGRHGVGRWPNIEARLAQFATVVTYDRAGLGWSARSDRPPTVHHMSNDLHSLLEKLELPKPLALVGHWEGSQLCQLYACEYPDSVAGVLLLDPTPNDTFEEFRRAPAHVQTAIRSMVLNQAKAAADEGSAWEVERMMDNYELVWRAVVEEKRMPDVEVVVVTSCGPSLPCEKQGDGKSRVDRNRHMAERFKRGRHISAERCSHETLLARESDLICSIVQQILLH